MLSILKISVIFLIILSKYGNITTSDGTSKTTTLSSQEQVKKEFDPLKLSIRKIIDSPASVDLKFELGVILGEVKKIIERAVKAELEKIGLEKEKIGLEKEKIGLEKEKIYFEKEKDKTRRLTVSLSIRNKAIKIENRHQEIKGDSPAKILKVLKPYDKPIIQRQYKWVALQKCNNDCYIVKLQNDLKAAYSKVKSNTKDNYEQFILDFCYAIASVVEDVNEKIAHYEFEGMEQDLDFVIGDPVINPYLALFYNSVVARDKNAVFNSM